MGLGVGIFLTAVGAILAFAVSATTSGINIHTVGWILMIVGIAGIVLSMIFWSSWAGPGYWRTAAAAARRPWTRAPQAPRSRPPARSTERETGRREPPRLVSRSSPRPAARR